MNATTTHQQAIEELAYRRRADTIRRKAVKGQEMTVLEYEFLLVWQVRAILAEMARLEKLTEAVAEMAGHGESVLGGIVGDVGSLEKL